VLNLVLSGGDVGRSIPLQSLPGADQALPLRTRSGDDIMPALQEGTVQGIDSKVLLTALSALRKGDFTARLPLD
jgi:hypothetical protein